jgi:myo-inositol-1(or 4)-monophosphatase
MHFSINSHLVVFYCHINQIVEEAGGTVTRMDGSPFSVFDRSVLVSNGVLHKKLLEKIQPPTEKLIADGFDFSQWLKPTDYVSDV